MTLVENGTLVLDELAEASHVQVDEDVFPAPIPEASDGSGGTNTDEDNTESVVYLCAIIKLKLSLL
jgi:hypothetical protein